jgi:hypothetical protein
VLDDEFVKQWIQIVKVLQIGKVMLKKVLIEYQKKSEEMFNSSLLISLLSLLIHSAIIYA